MFVQESWRVRFRQSRLKRGRGVDIASCVREKLRCWISRKGRRGAGAGGTCSADSEVKNSCLSARDGMLFRRLVAAGHGAEADGGAVPSVDGSDNEGQIDEFGFIEVFPHFFVDIVRRMSL
jgi:hypothetical protein